MLGFISIYPSFLSPTTLPLPTQYMCVKCHPQYLSHLRGSSNKSVLQIWEDEILYILLKCSYMQTNFINIVAQKCCLLFTWLLLWKSFVIHVSNVCSFGDINVENLFVKKQK